MSRRIDELDAQVRAALEGNTTAIAALDDLLYEVADEAYYEGYDDGDGGRDTEDDYELGYDDGFEDGREQALKEFGELEGGEADQG